MKKLYSKGKVHPSLPAIADHLSLLPATILTLTVALSPEDKQVLAYLISCSGTSNNFSGHRKTAHKSGLHGGGGGGDHPPQFHCNCFRCYMSYWVRWDTSPNRQLIHEILDAYEEGLFQKKNVKMIKKERRKRVSNLSDEKQRDSGESESVEVSSGGDIVDHQVNGQYWVVLINDQRRKTKMAYEDFDFLRQDGEFWCFLGLENSA
ncbi:hypothetical protein F0562_008237 [Nyssa sinensis]|uniref:Uncharacterized protein n=1 Tax=Nyssa sinensis TaxID=561372 RepID=A0A5J5A7T0_9ASTE|nr:hypothetical protein F0562_008237 [Nyssa sinensis]